MHLMLSFIGSMPLEAEVLTTKILQTAHAGIMSYDASLLHTTVGSAHVSRVHRHLFIFCMGNTHPLVPILHSQGCPAPDAKAHTLLIHNSTCC